ncbi:MAG TPA: hypothetical protein VHL11_22405 [Phototrophicaceae bacterium]|jgi:hypothetical protein|nr:hypothetical protein [Phototrophicaceae bacterium]
MPHQVLTGKHPDIVVLRYFGDIEKNDILTDPTELGLEDGHLKYLLADASEVYPSVPEGMWEQVHKSIINHKNLAHIAIAVDSPVFRVLLVAVIKVTRQGNRVSLHQNRDQAETHLMGLIKAAG